MPARCESPAGWSAQQRQLGPAGPAATTNSHKTIKMDEELFNHVAVHMSSGS